jgi:hypothetical protein
LRETSRTATVTGGSTMRAKADTFRLDAHNPH